MIGHNGTPNPAANGNTHAPKFMPGNKLSRGNPFGGKIEKFRARLMDKVTPEQFDRVVKALIAKAEAGEGWAIREFFDRLIGKSTERVEVSGHVEVLQEVRASIARILTHPRIASAVEDELDGARDVG